MASARHLAHRERIEFADLLAGLTTQQWSAPSLCAGWTVRDVAAHTIGYLDQGVGALLRRMIVARGDVDRVNGALHPTVATLPESDLVDRMRRGARPAGAGALYGSRVALIECLIHQQDIRRPLGLLRPISGDALRVALTYARVSPVIGGARRTRGVRLVATDLDWSAGRGPDVAGPGEALLLTMTGRIAAVRDELTGEGVAAVR
ncbi:maleylpyruvate isomerase family mycothiol-dependent enzyme [Mycobacterium sp. SMC-4]|uniref:maleylpyruvate isomerase family mycothiol-dependent enzyme n=1 Tax=Mycobacterium sp. SMC-4 TaxID=2857059 RepID=UPI0021B3CF89|nr:maleylpyruvate isomerase family mycothiol-dependent enzyme [Mycobacterium sp. SMC-4]UXA17644.1 maleylpyruvate isomerase family mycothiol-dependent enzyme [Mycobacterium sp. SMC-4]